MRGDFGEVGIETPRIRNGDFEPKLVQTPDLAGNFTETIISVYGSRAQALSPDKPPMLPRLWSAMSTREIEDHIKQICGIEISPRFVSRATEQLQQQITDGRAAR